MLELQAHGALAMDSDQPLHALFSDLFEPLKLRGKTDNTRRQYAYAMGKLRDFLGRAPLASDFNDRTLADLMAWMDASGYAARSINNCRAYLLAFWRFLARKSDEPRLPGQNRGLLAELVGDAVADFGALQKNPVSAAGTHAVEARQVQRGLEMELPPIVVGAAKLDAPGQPPATQGLVGRINV
jgi:hypothetical protein